MRRGEDWLRESGGGERGDASSEECDQDKGDYHLSWQDRVMQTRLLSPLSPHLSPAITFTATLPGWGRAHSPPICPILVPIFHREKIWNVCIRHPSPTFTAGAGCWQSDWPDEPSHDEGCAAQAGTVRPGLLCKYLAVTANLHHNTNFILPTITSPNILPRIYHILTSKKFNIHLQVG